MSIANSIRAQIPPIHPEGYPFIGGFALASLVLFLLWTPLGWIGTVLTVWCALFFRDPVRVTPVREGIVVSPADGRVSMIAQVLPPAELGLGDKPLTRISVFMSVFNCHVNRSPATGRIDRIAYRPGIFVNAELDKASEDNERNSLVISTPNGRIGVIQIAGLVARRIVCFVREGQSIGAGERFGLIRFGSRLDVYLPEGTKSLVSEGQTAVAGETILADFVNFGVAPGLILYFWQLHDLNNGGWIVAMVFAISGGLRLARFNATMDDPNKPAFAANFFTGVPAPAGAITVL